VTEPAPDTADLRSGAPLHDALLALLPLVGVWRGRGNGVVDNTDEFAYGQEIRFAHDGRPFLAYESRAWLLNPDGSVLRQAWRESGFWRPGPTQDDIEVILASNTGQAMVYLGHAGDLRWELESISLAPAPSAKRVDGEKRLYALVNDELAYATDLAPKGRPFAPHLQARLTRA
jgi:hypothetical protein